jgi:hypothetical protein
MKTPTRTVLLNTPSPGFPARTIRIWFGDAPEAQYPSREVLSRTARGPAMAAPRPSGRVVTEIYRPGCGPSTFALLGASFTPAESDELRIETVVAASPGPTAPWTIAPYSEFTHVGLQRLYAEAALHAAATEGHTVAIGGDQLRFDRAVEDAVGSSPWLFGVLGRAIVHLLATDSSSKSDQELAELFRGLLVIREHPRASNTEHNRERAGAE